MHTTDNFKIGDTVVRINRDNGDKWAKVGQKATIIGITRWSYITVRYPGRECEDWLPENAQKVEDAPAPEETTVSITIGGGLKFSLTNHNNLVVEDAFGRCLANLGVFSKARAKALTEYINRLAIHVE